MRLGLQDETAPSSHLLGYHVTKYFVILYQEWVIPLWLPFSGSSVNCLLCKDRTCCFQILPTSSEVCQRARQGAGRHQQMSSAAAWPYHEAVSPTPFGGWALVLFIKRSKSKCVFCVVRKACASSTQWLLCRHWELRCYGIFLCRDGMKSEFFSSRLMFYVKGKKCCCVLSSQMRWKVGFAKFTLQGRSIQNPISKDIKQKWVSASQLAKVQGSIAQAGVQWGQRKQ